MREHEKKEITELTENEGRSLIVDLSAEFHRNQWMTGTGGALAIKCDGGILITPSGVLKERQSGEDVFVVNGNGEVVKKPATNLKISSCMPNFMHIFRQRDAGTIFHLHNISAVLVSQLWPEDVFKAKHLQMIKGIRGFGWEDLLEIPIIENRSTEDALSDLVKEALDKNFKADCILIRGHGLYTWGATWTQAKVHAESLDWIFQVVIQMRQLGLQVQI